MMRENSNFGQQDSDTLALKLASGDLNGVNMIGETCDKIYKNGVLVDEIHGHNLVVNSFLKLVMALLKRQEGYSGATYWAIGSGATLWDSELPSPTLDEIKLTNEIGRKSISASEIKFVDSTFNESSTPTNIIQITHTFGPEDCNGEWREFAIFGGNATSTANSGIMINKRTHAVINKTSEMTVERTIRFTLTLS